MDNKKVLMVAIIALILAIAGYSLASSLDQDIAFEIVKNNTDLCNFNHTSLTCNGTRQDNVTYYTNNTPIVLYVFAHADTSGQTAGVFLYRDDVLVEAQSGRPLAAPEETWRGITAIIPKNSSYRVNFTNYHHFEWYEDQILSGRNGTLSIINNNYTNLTGCVGDCYFNNLNINSLGKNDTTDIYGVNINLLVPLKHISGTSENQLDLGNASNTHFDLSSTDTNYATSVYGNGSSGEIIISIDNAFIRAYNFNQSRFSLGGANLTDCANCGGSQNLTQVLIQGNNATNNSIEYLNNLNMSGKIKAGFNYEYSDDSVINIMRNVDDTDTTIHGHAFADNSVVTRNISTNGGLGYNSFDSLPTIDTRSNHYAGFQARPNLISVNGTNMTTFYGFYTYPTISKYNLTTAYAFKVFNPNFSNNGNIATSYGLYVEAQTNTTNFYSITTGNGKAGLGTHIPTAQLQINSTGSIGYLEPVFTMYDTRGLLRTRLYEAGLQQWYLNNSGVENGLISFGFPANNPGMAILNGSLGNRQDLSIDSTNGGWLFGTGNTGSTPPVSIWMNVSGDVSLLKAGGGVNIKEGTNAKMGACTLVAGGCLVSTTAVKTNSRIFLTSQVDGGTPGFLRVSSRIDSTRFQITSSSGTDTSTVAWIIFNPS